MWAWVWDSRNKGPVAGRTSDIRNETPGPLVRNESGDRNLDFEVYFRGRRNLSPERSLNHFRPPELNFDPEIKSVYGSDIGE